MPRITTPELALKLKRALGTRGFPPLHNVDETASPVIIIEDLTGPSPTQSNQYAVGVSQTADVALRSIVALENPVGSNIVVSVRQVMAHTITSDNVSLRYGRWLSGPGVVCNAVDQTGHIIGQPARSSRATFNTGRPADVAQIGQDLAIFRNTTAFMYTFEFILNPGQLLYFETASVNVAMSGSFRWIETSIVP